MMTPRRRWVIIVLSMVTIANFFFGVSFPLRSYGKYTSNDTHVSKVGHTSNTYVKHLNIRHFISNDKSVLSRKPFSNNTSRSISTKNNLYSGGTYVFRRNKNTTKYDSLSSVTYTEGKPTKRDNTSSVTYTEGTSANNDDSISSGTLNGKKPSNRNDSTSSVTHNEKKLSNKDESTSYVTHHEKKLSNRNDSASSVTHNEKKLSNKDDSTSSVTHHEKKLSNRNDSTPSVTHNEKKLSNKDDSTSSVTHNENKLSNRNDSTSSVTHHDKKPSNKDDSTSNVTLHYKKPSNKDDSTSSVTHHEKKLSNKDDSTSSVTHNENKLSNRNDSTSNVTHHYKKPSNKDDSSSSVTYSESDNFNEDNVVTMKYNESEYLVYSNACTIAVLDPFSPEIMEYVNIAKHVDDTHCKPIIELTYKKGYTIFVNKTAIEQDYSHFKACVYMPFFRAGDFKNKYIYDKMKLFNKSMDAKDEFVSVFCFYGRQEPKLYTKHYSFIFRNEKRDASNRMKYRKAKTTRPPTSVLLIVLESTSRLNFIRHMNWTRDFLLNDLHAVEMLGYNKAGLNSYPNMAATLLGLEPEITKPLGVEKEMDDVHFIWKNFTALGYTTFHSEDMSPYGTFHYYKLGFKKRPFTHEMRPYMLQSENTLRGECNQEIRQTKLIFDSLDEFVRTYSDVPYFAWAFPSSITHETSNYLSLEDMPLLNKLRALKRDGHLDNTITIVMGDHGIRTGDISKTYQGWVEEQLPALYIAPPQWFREERKDLYDNLKANSRKLTNNYDVFATFLDIIDLSKGYRIPKVKAKQGTSLFREISSTRSCADINIPPQFCTCSNFKKVQSITIYHKLIAVWIVRKMNTYLYNIKDKCAQLKLKHLSEVRTKRLSKHVRSFFLSFSVHPSNGTFNGQIKHDYASGQLKLLEPPTRTSLYRKQPHCIQGMEDGKFLQNYCYCKKQLDTRN